MKIVYNEKKQKTTPFRFLKPGDVFSLPIKDEVAGHPEEPNFYLKLNLCEEEMNAFLFHTKEETQIDPDADCILYEATLKVERR